MRQGSTQKMPDKTAFPLCIDVYYFSSFVFAGPVPIPPNVHAGLLVQV